ncbi:MAG: heme lyase CcmF/NrfE family subunit [Myxococcaceae bacterium]
MSSTLGMIFVYAGVAFALFGTLIGLWGGMSRREAVFPWVLRSVYGFAGCMLAANLTMVYALVTHDFSVKYVAQVGSLATPTLFTVVSLWSALEGSILFWGLIIGLYLFAFALAHRKEQPRYMSLALGMMLACGTFFAFLIAGPAMPFGLPPPPRGMPLGTILTDGPGPNALLQNHILMVIHPPMLYLGYVGMVVPFGAASAALLGGELGDAWMAKLRKWTLIPWAFLSVGIILGSWWAYEVLGWGGYWAWDPVENASFHPWLTATAFIHSTMVTERKKMLKVWTLSLAMGTFLLTIVGTFMTRSGVFNSVHSFTQSDIGPTFLVFIAVILVFSVALLTIRGPMLMAENAIRSPASREASILLNNLLFVMVTFVVFIGTVYPLIAEAVRGVRVSVGEPYFNRMALPVAVAILFLMGIGPVLPWGEAKGKTVLKQVTLPGIAAVVTAVACLALGLGKNSAGTAYHVYAIVTFSLAAFVTVVTLRELFRPAFARMTEKKENFVAAFIDTAAKSRRRTGGYIVHLGIVLIFISVAASSSYVTQVKTTLGMGKSAQIGGYQVQFLGLERGREPHRIWTGAKVEVTSPSGATETMMPRVNYYERSTDPVGSPMVRSKPGHDLYLSLLAFDTERQTASLNMFIFPLVGGIWGSIFLLVLGSAIAAWPARKRPATVGETAPNPLDSQRGAA